LSDRYDNAAIAAAKKKGLDQATFVAAIFFRDIDDAPSTSRDISPVIFVGSFEFPFPQRGDHIPRDEHEWLGIDEAYCLDEQQKSEDDDDYIGHFRKPAEQAARPTAGTGHVWCRPRAAPAPVVAHLSVRLNMTSNVLLVIVTLLGAGCTSPTTIRRPAPPDTIISSHADGE